ncbi:hypothetical protein V8G54_032947 [Vigna mungo]|uniref:VDE lipocalin domain-containing protein n=1 Tax=Vigna mungo TaxID=3915 RepID=A0AAQ3MNE9_VIGMU
MTCICRYILSSKIENKPDDYVFVYYRGRNDAWDGYGGAVVYTRSAVLPESIVPELERAAKNVGRDFSKFIKTDNTCGPEPSLVERLEKKVEEGEETIVKEVEQLEEEVEKVGKTEVTLFQKLAEGFKVFQEDEENFLKGLSKEEMEILNGLKMEARERDFRVTSDAVDETFVFLLFFSGSIDNVVEASNFQGIETSRVEVKGQERISVVWTEG